MRCDWGDGSAAQCSTTARAASASRTRLTRRPHEALSGLITAGYPKLSSPGRAASAVNIRAVRGVGTPSRLRANEVNHLSAQVSVAAAELTTSAPVLSNV